MNRASKPVYTNIGVRGKGFLLLTLANYFFSYAKPTPKSAIKKGEYHSPPFISVSASVNPKPIAKKSIPISLHRGSTLFFLNHSICYFLSAKRKNPVNETTMLKTAIIPIQLVVLVSFKLFQLPNIRLKDSKLNAMLDKTVIGKTTIEPTATITNIFCLSFIAKFNQ